MNEEISFSFSLQLCLNIFFLYFLLSSDRIIAKVVTTHTDSSLSCLSFEPSRDIRGFFL